ncbi:RNA polymerase sigma factor [Rhizohabitans arisaemae]|uniref:RNA polymerase sigma factor n=1 Tax=Rhizohabitans arisaemae TaxID=2720610 RepID=UPI0024B25791|nr:hypothetical protein [Rhizohabitans arisaemae]
MPGWRVVGHAEERELAESLRRGEPQATAELYDAYGERLYDYCHAILYDDAGAAEAVRHTLAGVAGHIHRLTDLGRFRPWLYAMTRARLLGRPLPPSGTSNGRSPVAEEAPVAEPARTVSETLRAMAPQEREVLILVARHGLGVAEAAAVLGTSSKRTGLILARAGERLERAAAADVLTGPGMTRCPDLAVLMEAMAAETRGLRPLRRKRVTRHVVRCAVCDLARRRHVSAAALLAAVPPRRPPLSLGRKVADAADAPRPPRTRPAGGRAGGFAANGFPVVRDHSVRPAGRRPGPIAVSVAGLFAVMFGVAAVGAAQQNPPGSVQAAKPPAAPYPPAGTPSADRPAPGPKDALRPDPGPTRVQAAPRPPAPTSRATRRPILRPSRTPAPRPTASPRPPRRAVLAVDCPDPVDELGLGTMTLTARHAAVSWSAVVRGDAVVSPGGGRLGRGADVTLSITVTDLSAPGAATITIFSDGGDSHCELAWHGESPAPLPSGTDPTEDENSH